MTRICGKLVPQVRFKETEQIQNLFNCWSDRNSLVDVCTELVRVQFSKHLAAVVDDLQVRASTFGCQVRVDHRRRQGDDLGATTLESGESRSERERISFDGKFCQLTSSREYEQIAQAVGGLLQIVAGELRIVVWHDVVGRPGWCL